MSRYTEEDMHGQEIEAEAHIHSALRRAKKAEGVLRRIIALEKDPDQWWSPEWFAISLEAKKVLSQNRN